jgi:hypothetical protein
MGFGDAFVAATVGCLLALPAAGPGMPVYPALEARRQFYAAALVAIFGLCFDLLFFALDTLPATVPVALALALSDAVRRSPG